MKSNARFFTKEEIHLCLSKTKIQYNQDNLVKIFDENIWLYSIPAKYKKNVKEGIQDFHTEKTNYNKKKRDTLNVRLATLQNEKTPLIKIRSNGEITADEFIELKNNLINEIQEIKDHLIQRNKKKPKFWFFYYFRTPKFKQKNKIVWEQSYF